MIAATLLVAVMLKAGSIIGESSPLLPRTIYNPAATSTTKTGNNDESFSSTSSLLLSSSTPLLSKLSANMSSSKVLNVHVVPHTHDDVGWLKTVDQYYFGLNESIQQASVHEILDSVIASLSENPSRTFTYVEQKFFSMWWNRQNDAVRDIVRFLIANQQLSFVNGGWCMHDEAATHFMGMIDQTTLGHSFLKRELGVIPKVGWQLDPFGHSATQASLMTSKMGFDALYFGRIDYQDLALRKLEQECEGLWNSSTSLNGTTIYWGLTGSHSGMYGAPSGFCFDAKCGENAISLIGLNTSQLELLIVDFLRKIRVQSEQIKGNHIMLTMGEDFQVRLFSRFPDLLIPS
jgi:alpha-mannosidase